MQAHRSLAAATQQVATSIQRLSSGLRINSAADDPAGLGISERMRGQISGLAQANRNVQDGMSLLDTVDGALGEVVSILQRARQLAVEWNNDTYSTNDRLAIQAEWTQLSNEIGHIRDTATFNGIPLLQNANALITLQVGANAGEQVTITMASLMGPGAQDLVKPVSFFALPFLPQSADLQGLDYALDDVNGARSRFGALRNRLEHTLNFNTVQQEQLTAAESRIRDVDMADEMVTLTKAQILQQTSTAMLKQANQNSQSVLTLLKNLR